MRAPIDLCPVQTLGVQPEGLNARFHLGTETMWRAHGHVLAGAGPASVQTPEEVYEALTRDGYRVDYYRVPLTDGTAPKVMLRAHRCNCVLATSIQHFRL